MTGSSGQLFNPEQLRDISKDIRRVVVSIEETDGNDDQIKLPKPPADARNRSFQSTIEDVLFTSGVSSLEATHRVAAWNTLSTIIDQSVASQSAKVRKILWTDGLWSRAFDVYIVHASSARPKSIRQLLTTLTSALCKGSYEDTGVYRKRAVEILVDAVFDFDDHRRAKTSTPFLSNLLAKDVVSLEDVLSQVTQRQSHLKANSSVVSTQHILLILFHWLGKSDFGSSIGQLLSNLLDKFEQTHTQHSSDGPIWGLPLKNSISQAINNIDSLRVHALPVLFKRNFNQFVSFLYSHGLLHLVRVGSDDEVPENYDEENELLLCVALQAGNDLGLIFEGDAENIQITSDTVILPVQQIGRLLIRESRIVRLTGLALLIHSHFPTRPFTKATFDILRKRMPNFLADTDADFRSELFGTFQRLVDRLRSVAATQARLIKTQGLGDRLDKNISVDGPGLVLSEHKKFLGWLVQFLTWELRPTASYQRHISCLKCLSILLRSGLDPQVQPANLSKSALGEVHWPFQLQVMSDGLRDLLVTLLLDPFDDVRVSSANILALFTTEARLGPWGKAFDGALDRAEDMMLSTGRADQADGVAHLWALKHRLQSKSSIDTPSVVDFLVARLQTMLDIARKDLAEAINGNPMHGILTSLRYVIVQDAGNPTPVECSKLSTMLGEVWNIVKPTLCNDAPEGYLPDDISAGSNSTKEILSYCWRALKEASLLVNTLVLSTQTPVATIHRLCSLTFEQLIELRHRGAFSTVAQTWMTCGAQSKKLDSVSRRTMMEEWYADLIKMLEKNIQINTRRSAGLPSLLCGILVNDHSGTMLSQAVEDLERIARVPIDKVLAEGGTLSQVHAMNCIKDILKNTRLGDQSERHVPACLQLAADALHSDVWAIRNCGLMLFRAVIDRLLGTSDPHFVDDWNIQKRLSFEKYPQLLEVTLALLIRSIPSDTSAITSTSSNEGVFPALQLLQYMIIPDHRLTEVFEALFALMGNPSWHVRDKAARTYTALVDLQVIWFEPLLQQSSAGQNAAHGSLLASGYLLQKANRIQMRPGIPEDMQALDTFSKEAWSIAIAYLPTYIDESMFSPVMKAAYIDVVREALILVARTCKDVESIDCLAQDPLKERDGQFCLSVRGIRRYLDKWKDKIGSAVVLQALARLFAVQLVVMKNLNQIDKDTAMDLFMTFASVDEDACSHLMNQIENLLHLADEDSLEIICQACMTILSGLFSDGLKIAAQDLIIRLASEGRVTSFISRISTQDLSNLLTSPNFNQHYADGWLCSEAARLESSVVSANSSINDTLNDNIASWAEHCTAAVAENNIFTREAAAESLDQAKKLWQVLSAQERHASNFSQLCLSVYDLLNDDDEDTRTTASRITRRILQTQSRSLEPDSDPISASQKLLTFCIEFSQTTTSIPTLQSTTFQRSFGPAKSVADQLARSLKKDTSLFIREKQNLYIDEFSELHAWSRALLKLCTAESPLGKDLQTKLHHWVSEGLDVLNSHAEANSDGGLGWSTGADAFVLGMRVVYGAEVLVSLRTEEEEREEVRGKLEGFLDACEKGGVNCLWRWEMGRILGRVGGGCVGGGGGGGEGRGGGGMDGVQYVCW